MRWTDKTLYDLELIRDRMDLAALERQNLPDNWDRWVTGHKDLKDILSQAYPTLLSQRQ
jgi:hypothetical protein